MTGKCFFTLALSVLLAGAASAEIAVTTKQVLVEPKIVEVSKTVTQELLYQAGAGRDVKTEIAALLTPLPDNTTQVDVSAVTFGGGSEFRHWVPQGPVLLAEPKITASGAVQMTLRPQKTDLIYIDKRSALTPAAAFLFGAMGSQYAGPGADAAATPGKVCPITGKPMAEGSKPGGVSKAVNQAGMAAGMGLLTSQAKGQLTGLKSTFIVPYRPVKLTFKFEAQNKEQKKTENLTVPLISGNSTLDVM